MSAAQPGGADGPRVSLVTGASSGIGRATAHRLAREGDHLVLMARTRSPLEETARECREAGAAGVHVVAGDVGVDADVTGAVDAVLARHGRLDVVVHSAAVVAYGRLQDVPAPVWDAAMRTNLTGTANVARAALPVLRRQRRGHLVLLGSVLGQVGVPGMSAYAVSKWAVRSLARSLQLENRDLPDVLVSLVVPGGVDTPIYHVAASYLGHVGRPPPPVTTPQRVAGTVVDLLRRPRKRVDVGAANVVMTGGFVLLPAVYDALVGPLFARLALQRAAAPEGPGNVLDGRAGDQRLRGRSGSGLRAMVGGLAGAVGRREEAGPPPG